MTAGAAAEERPRRTAGRTGRKMSGRGRQCGVPPTPGTTAEAEAERKAREKSAGGRRGAATTTVGPRADAKRRTSGARRGEAREGATDKTAGAGAEAAMAAVEGESAFVRTVERAPINLILR
eukprot:CAMPEP_0117614064 /NCGR_PEP_ID=MMETSP0784-20121206/83822_1 /TAXON_ID=39447 /ORGANISM="" /LENGTH=121 /DNA_ID=CAMNT_0005417739 /DNA_START=81 /DNA_END=443 /DNA_ORIENTATION=+